uniref:Serine protease K12H4.7 n=1 Tax=Strongyloides papillosus TaxID=174720 RepID=A0A0N5BE36_STREA
MFKFGFLLLGFFILITSSWVSSKSPRKIPGALRFLNGRPYAGFRGHRFNIPKEKREAFEKKYNEADYEFYFTQILDHFSSNDSRTWNQRYFFNDEYYQDGGPQFLNIGGEGPESYMDVTYPELPFIMWAKELKAMVFSLEHRFYGKSRPFTSQTVPALTYLTSRQAIEDIANFIRSMNIKKNIKNPKWIIFGGSYSGALSMWTKRIHPEIIHGSISSSSPAQVTLDFYKYMETCEASFYKNGSYLCGEE